MVAISPPACSALDTIGNTPIVQLRRLAPATSANVFLKLEGLNPTGSYKDRMARSIIEEAERRSALRPGMSVVEITGGSTGSALAFVCALKGYRFEVVSSPIFAAEKLKTMRAFGANLHLVQSMSGGHDAGLFPSMRKIAVKMSESGDCYFTDQFRNPDAIIGYKEMGKELACQLPAGIDVFCGAVGSAGMLMGVARTLREDMPRIKIVALEPASSPILTKGYSGSHGIDGIGTGAIPAHLNDDFCDEVRAIDEQEARAMCRRLAREEGLLVGTSTGLNVVAALALAAELGPGKTVVTVACDSGMKYLSGDLLAGL
ncbi:pyridoxal phosphate-dependent enzyme, beta subunit, partial [Aureobasidium melanogenum]